MKALPAHPGPANDALLVRVIAAPESLRPADRRGAWPLEDLRSGACWSSSKRRLVRPRTRLAEAMADRLSRLDDQDPVRAFLLAADPANCGAQAVFLERGVFSKEINAKLQQQLASYSAQAFAHLLKVSSEVELGARGSRPVASASDVASPAGSDPSVRVAQLLWSDKFGASLTARLSEPHSLEKQADSVLLAATIPQDTMRRQPVEDLSQTLARRTDDRGDGRRHQQDSYGSRLPGAAEDVPAEKR